MKLEVKAIITGGFVINSPVTARSHTYELVIFSEKNTHYISIAKKVVNYEEYNEVRKNCI